MDNEHNVPAGMASYPIQQLWSVAYGNLQLVPQTHNVLQDSSVIINSANLFAIAMETVFQTSSVFKTCVKKFVEKMAIVTQMRSVKEFNVSKDAEETVIVPQGKLVKTINALVRLKRTYFSNLESYDLYTSILNCFVL